MLVSNLIGLYADQEMQRGGIAEGMTAPAIPTPLREPNAIALGFGVRTICALCGLNSIGL